jgi:hypothetical protein
MKREKRRSHLLNRQPLLLLPAQLCASSSLIPVHRHWQHETGHVGIMCRYLLELLLWNETA